MLYSADPKTGEHLDDETIRNNVRGPQFLTYVQSNIAIAVVDISDSWYVLPLSSSITVVQVDGTGHETTSGTCSVAS